MVRCPKVSSSVSPTLTSLDGFATLPFIDMCPPLAASAATVRLFISLDTFKYLSSLILTLLL
jgi:hypothetical protein